MGLERLDPQEQVEALVVNMGERVGRVDRQRREHRVDLGVKKIVEKPVLRVRELTGSQSRMPCFCNAGALR